MVASRKAARYAPTCLNIGAEIIKALDGEARLCRHKNGPERSNHPPAKPEALRLLAPQRGLIAIAKTPARPKLSPGISAFRADRNHLPANRNQSTQLARPNSRKCQTSTATPAKPGDLLFGLGLRLAFPSTTKTLDVYGITVHTGIMKG